MGDEIRLVHAQSPETQGAPCRSAVSRPLSGQRPMQQYDRCTPAFPSHCHCAATACWRSIEASGLCHLAGASSAVSVLDTCLTHQGSDERDCHMESNAV